MGGSHPKRNQEVRPPNMEENPWSQYHQRLGGYARLRAHSRYIHIKQENGHGHPDTTTIEPRLPSLHIYRALIHFSDKALELRTIVYIDQDGSYIEK